MFKHRRFARRADLQPQASLRATRYLDRKLSHRDAPATTLRTHQPQRLRSQIQNAQFSLKSFSFSNIAQIQVCRFNEQPLARQIRPDKPHRTRPPTGKTNQGRSQQQCHSRNLHGKKERPGSSAAFCRTRFGRFFRGPVKCVFDHSLGSTKAIVSRGFTGRSNPVAATAPGACPSTSRSLIPDCRPTATDSTRPSSRRSTTGTVNGQGLSLFSRPASPNREESVC